MGHGCRSGRSVAVVEAHSIPGGAAHHWERDGYHFDSGAALFSGLPTPANAGITANPVSSVLAALGETVDAVDLPDTATCLVYPDGRQYRTQLGSERFQSVVAERHGPQVAAEWAAFQAEVQRLFATAGSVEPAAVRLDDGAPCVLGCHCHVVLGGAAQAPPVCSQSGAARVTHVGSNNAAAYHCHTHGYLPPQPRARCNSGPATCSSLCATSATRTHTASAACSCGAHCRAAPAV